MYPFKLLTLRPQPATSGSPRSPGLGVRAARLLVIVMLVWTTWWAVTNWWELMRPTVAVRPDVPASENSPPPALFSGFELAAGQWSFAGQSWNLQIADLAAAEVHARLKTPAPVPADLPPLTQREAEFLSLLPQLPFETKTHGTGQSHTWRTGGMQLALHVARIGGSDRLVGVRLLLFGERGEAKLFSATPRECHLPAATVLLTMPEASEMIAFRENDDGVRACEVLLVPGSLEETIDRWTAAGWRVRSHPFSGTGGAWLCVRGSECLSVMTARVSPERSLLAVLRVSTPAVAP